MNSPNKAPLLFISHDTRDAKIAEAFSKLIKKVISKNIRIFRSSDSHGSEGIEYGTEWFRQIRDNIKEASYMICLLTRRSIDRPWVLWEAGVAYGREIPVCCVIIGMSIEEACKGPFAHFQNCHDSSSALTGLLNRIIKHFNNIRNEIITKKAVEEFLKEKDIFLAEHSPQIVDSYLNPYPEVTMTLQKMERKLFAIDGIIEICRSIGYSGWSPKDVAPPKIIEQRALPREFLDYEGEDALCDTGSQARYSLKDVIEPLHDEGSDSKLRTILARSEYADVYRLSRLLDKPFIKRNEQIWSGRSLYGYSWYPLNKSPLVHNVNVQPTIITSDDKTGLIKRSLHVHHYQGTWSASIEEQMAGIGDKVIKADLNYFACAERGVEEELGCTPISKRTKILSIGIEHQNLSASFLAIVYINETFKELCEKWEHKSRDPYEASAIDAVILSKANILKLLRETEFAPTKNIFIRADGSKAKWHPTSRMRLYALKCHLYGL